MPIDSLQNRTEIQAAAMREALLMSESEFASDLIRSVHAVTMEGDRVVALLCFSPGEGGPAENLGSSSVIILQEKYGASLELPDQAGNRMKAPLDEARKSTLDAYAQRAGRILISLLAVSAIDMPAKGRGLETMDRDDIEKGLTLWLEESHDAATELLRRANQRDRHPEDPPDRETEALTTAQQALATAAAALASIKK